MVGPGKRCLPYYKKEPADDTHRHYPIDRREERGMTRPSDPSDPRRPWSATVVETLTANPYFSVLLQHVTVTDGTHRTYYTLDFATPAVGIVARRGTDVLLVRQYRFIVDEYVWAIPSGGVAHGETPRSAAMRELKEETGYEARSMAPLLHCYASYGCGNQRYDIFVADGLEDSGSPVDDNEVLDVRWFSADELLALIQTNGIVDNLSLSPLLFVLLDDRVNPRPRPAS
jgi:8-oxo-dGTP pyrophosphatase MutT (NUDIX family)